MEEITDRNAYFKQKAINLQNRIVNYKSSTTITSEALVWTYRTTNCDVISIITTAAPIKDGTMKDIRIENHDVKRLKPPTVKKSHKDVLNDSPYDVGLSVDLDKKRKKINQQLHLEKKEFMSKLNITRMVRTKLENDAAKRIQSIFRGFSVRNSLDEIRYYCSIHALIRTNIRSYLENAKYSTKILSEYRMERQKLRNNSAALIQCTFLRYLSRRCYRGRLYEKKLKLRHSAASIIQAYVRGMHSRARVRFMQQKNCMVKIVRAALKIQCAFRRMIAKRRVRVRRFKLRFLACRIIQNWYRASYSKRMAAHIKAVMLARKLFNGAKAIQKIVRSFLARRRVNRVRFRCVYKLVFKSVTRIQSLVRKFLGTIAVKKRRELKLVADAAEEKQRALNSQQVELAKINAENLALLESADIFIQAKKGNTVNVEDIFKGLMGGDPHSPTDTNSAGDTLLTIAATTGNMDLLRKCILWGFDINHHNLLGQNAIMIAAKSNNMAVFQYLLSFHPSSSGNDKGSDKPVLSLTDEEIGFLYVAAAANAAISDLSMLQALLAVGFDVNAKSAGDGMTAIHAAAEVGHADAFKLLVKNKARVDQVDELGQTPLHKACCSSLKLVQWILGLDPDFPIFMNDETRRAAVLALDIDGKDCSLHASISGQSDILEQLENVLETTGGAKNDNGDQEIGWSPNDITKGLQLVEHGNLYCIRKIITVGFDPSWPQEETSLTMALVACKLGDLDVIDLLMEFGADFSCVDAHGRTVMHFAAECSNQPVVAHLLSHTHAAKCNIKKELLLKTDTVRLENAFHYSARAGIEINVDLLVGHEIVSKMLMAKNKDGLTPLLVACSFYQERVINLYLKLGADPTVVDNHGRGCLWHLFHPDVSVVANRRVWCSEYIWQCPSADIQNKSRKDRDDDVARVNIEASLVITLLKSGCTLYENYALSPEEIRELPFQNGSPPVAHEDVLSEPGDIIIQEYCYAFLKQVVSVISPLDAWKLLIAAIRFDDGTMKTLLYLFKVGMFDVIAPSDDLIPSQPTAVSTTSINSSSATEEFTETRKNRQSIIGNITKSASVDIVIPPKMSEQMFQDINLLGWSIRLHNVKVVQYIVKKGYNVTQPVDFRGNPCLHYVAMYGTPEMVDVLITDKRLRWEQENRRGFTAGMLAAKSGNIRVARKLFANKASARRSLDGKYAGWVLAFVRRAEKFEICTQTGRYGNDDELYFSTAPDPFFITWFSFS